ncbi:MAG: hypothetical protein AABO58_23990 [Acidobacteriota bacterium]
MTKRLAAIALFLLVAIAAIAPIRSYDYFWHLAAGRWIVDHHAIPVHDPLAVASAKTPWINGEWLYEVVLVALHVNDDVISILNALLVAAIFTAGFWFAARTNDWPAALVAAGVAFAGASDRLGVRPSTAAALLIVIAIGLLTSRISRMEIAYAALTIIWINVHPSALLAPLIALLFGRWIAAAVSATALLVNPYGWHAVRAPLELTSLVGSGEFVNAEWLPSDPKLFPLLYATFAVVLVLLLLARDKRANAWRFAVLLMLFALAVRGVRHQGLYFAALPLLLPPVRLKRDAIAIAAIIPIGWAFAHDVHRLGVDDQRFPLRAAAALKASQLPGNIYNVDQFGGLLEWTFYPARRVLTDGRNELFRQFIAEDARARKDSRAWHALIEKYRVTLAVDEYQTGKIEVVDVASGQRRALPASLVRYRRRDWALIAFDDAAMVFARRAAFPSERIAALEYRTLVPDDPSIGYANEQIRAAARQEVARARREFGDIRVVRELEAGAD